jgi:mersacidin/lichenicidin family type 2 lantibiotic
MSNIDVVRAWKDEQYRMSLSETERANLPQNPAGVVELTEGDLEGVVGGAADVSVTRTSCCTYSTTATACCNTSIE